jgi:hypothetical protein
MRRRSLATGLVAVVVASTAAAMVAAPAQASTTPSIHVVASHLNNPRGLTMSADGQLYVAEAGRGGTKFCISDPEFGTQCAGLTGSIDRVESHGVTRLVKGLFSIAGEGGVAAEGMVAVSASHGKLYGQFAGNTVGIDQAPLPKWLLNAATRELGQFGWVVGDDFHPAAGVGDHDFRWSDKHKHLVPAQFPDSNPNGVLVTGGRRFVVDAGANTLDEVTADGRVHVLTFLGTPDGSPTDAVPTCAAKGPDGALYVGELLGGNFAPGNARVWRIDVSNGGAKKSVWARGLTTIQGCGFDRWGNFYATEFEVGGLNEGPTADPRGAVVKIAPDRKRTVLGLGQLFFPSGFAAGKDGSIYVSNCSIAPASGFGPCPKGGQVVRIG